MVKTIERISVDHLWVFLLLCCSGNPLWNYINDLRQNFIACAIFVFLYVIVRKIKFSPFLKYAFIFAMISLVQLIVVPGASMSSAIFLILKMFIGYGIVSIVNTKFVKIYIDVMVTIAVISLILYAYNNLVGVIPGIRHSTEGVSIFIFNQLCSAAAGGGYVSRNCGMFWEPGAFQGYLNFALFFLLFMSNIKAEKMAVTIIIVSILTTKSTTGYLVMSFIILCYFIFKYEGNPILKIFFVMVIVGLFMYSYINLDFMQDKIQHHQNLGKNEEGRINDYSRFGILITENLLLGLSAEVNEKVHTGNGFLSFFLYYGILGILTYFVVLWKRMKKQGGKVFAILMMLLIFLLLQGECFLQYPCFLAWPFLCVNVDNKNNFKFVDDDKL